jgi:ferrochelatase
MRYQNPSVRAVLSEWKKAGITEIKVMPLYPQYARASTLSSEEAVSDTARELKYEPKITYLKPFYRNPDFIDAFSENISDTLAKGNWDHLLMSYHGLPERQIRNADASGSYCLKSKDCCNEINEKNLEFCYRAHCFETSRLIAKKLNLPADKWSVAFQSRLGVTEWIKPYTDIVLNELADQNVKDLVIACPAFTADCLETLEEIEMRAEDQFLNRGGATLKMVPSLNANDTWVNAVCAMAKSDSNFTIKIKGKS